MTPRVRIIDSETPAIDRAKLAQRPVCVQDLVLGERIPRILRWADARDIVASWFLPDNDGEILAGVNLAYDAACFAIGLPGLLKWIYRKYRRDEMRDLGIDQKIIDVAYGKPGHQYGMGPLCARYGLPIDKENEWRKRFGELEGLHPDEYPPAAKHYALEDVVQPAKIWPQQQEQARKFEERMGSPVLHIAGEKARTAWFQHMHSCWGVHTNPRRVGVFQRDVERKLTRLRRHLQVATIECDVKPTKRKPEGRAAVPFVDAKGKASTKAAVTYIEQLSERRGFTLKLSDKTGAPSVDKDSVEKSGSALLEAFGTYKSSKTLLGRANDLALGFEYPLQPRYTAMLITGRTSCSSGKNKDGTWPTPLRGTQLHNPPRAQGVRECFEPPYSDWRFFDADYPSAELHALAQVQVCWFGKSKLGDLLIEGKDVLLWFGATILNGIPYDEAKRLKDARDPRIKDMRQMAKAYIYGLPGGLGAAKMVTYARTNYGVFLSEKQAKRDKQTWMDALEMGPYFAKINKALRGRETGFLLHPMSGLWRGGAWYTELCNSGFQSLTAFGACDAAFHVSEECRVIESSALYGSRDFVMIHDQVLAAGHESRASNAADRLGELMTERYNLWTPDVPIKPGKTEGCVMRVWSKGAEPVRNPVTKKLEAWDWTHAVVSELGGKDKPKSWGKLLKLAIVCGSPLDTEDQLREYVEQKQWLKRAA